MSRDARIEFDWADGTHGFRLAWEQLSELQEKCDAGPYVVLQRLQNGSWRVEDVSNVIRLGLIGGGTTPADALKLVRRYVEARPAMENVIPAQIIMTAALLGAPEDSPGEGDAESPAKD